MTLLTRLLRVLCAALVAAAAAFPGAHVALANGLGDLYVAAPDRVDEVFLEGQRVVNKVDIEAGPARLAFSPDGSSLYVVDKEGKLARIDIETISLAQTYALSGVEDVAHPKGDSLFIAQAGASQLAVLADGEDAATGGPKLDAAPDLLAADRHEHRLVAAQAGHSWLDIVEPASASSKQVTLDGDVVALSVARDEGFAYIAMENPNEVAKVALDTGAVTWHASLTGAPSALTAVPGAAIVAVGNQLFRVKDGKAATWPTDPAAITADVTGLATSDEGAFVYVATEARIVAIGVANPKAPPPATVALAESVALAPVPKASSLVPQGGEANGTGAGSGTGTGTGTGSATASGRGEAASHAPATDTEDGGEARFRPAGQDPLLLAGVGLVIVVTVAVGSWAAMRRLAVEQ